MDQESLPCPLLAWGPFATWGNEISQHLLPLSERFDMLESCLSSFRLQSMHLYSLH